MHKHLEGRSKVNIACAKATHKRQKFGVKDFQQLKRHYCLADSFDIKRELTLRPYIYNDITNLRYLLLSPSFEESFDQQLNQGLAALL